MTAASRLAALGRIDKVVVFRALVLGDQLCALPALRAVRSALPDAEIVQVGLPQTRALMERLDPIDRFVDFPGWPGLPEVPCEVRAVPGFLAAMQAERFDLALQLHGSGPVVNELVALFGARHSAGFTLPHAWRPDADAALYRPWPEHGHEIERLLALTDHLGLPRQGLHLDFPVQDRDRQALAAAWPAWPHTARYVVVHAGAQLPSRRWPAERFAAVADAVAQSGATVVLTGTDAEAPIVAAVASAMRCDAVNLAGRTSLWSLGALVEGAEHVVCNDTGISHIAAALETPSVVVSSGADVSRWAPLDSARHHVLWHDLPCRPCAHAVCPIGHDCALAIEPRHVLAALDLQRQRVPIAAAA